MEEGDINSPSLITLVASSGYFIAGSDVTQPENIILDFSGGAFGVATGSEDTTTLEFAPGSNVSSADEQLIKNLIAAAGITGGLSVRTVLTSNPAADLIGLEEIGFIDTRFI